MAWYYLTQQDWNTLKAEIGQDTDLASGRYLSPEASKKSKRPLINEDRTMLLMWEIQGATIGTWTLWIRSPLLGGFSNPNTGVHPIKPRIILYNEERDSYKISPNITRESPFKLTQAQKRKVDRQNRIKNWKDYVSLIAGDIPMRIRVSSGFIDLNFRLYTEALQPILNPDGTSPYRTGFPFEPDNLYVINWNAKAPRIIGDES